VTDSRPQGIDDGRAGILGPLAWVLAGSLATGLLDLFAEPGFPGDAIPGAGSGILISLLLHLFWGFPSGMLIALGVARAARLRSRIGPERLNGPLLWLLAALPVLVLGIALGGPALERVTDPALRGLLLATGAMGLLAGGGLVGALLVRIAARLGLSSSPTAFRLLGILVALGLTAWWTFLSGRFRAGGLQGLLFLPAAGTLLLAIPALGLAWPLWPSRLHPGDLRWWTRWLVLGAGIPLVSLILAEGTARLDPDGVRWAAGRSSFSVQVLIAIRDVVDLDGDRASPILGGGDCDDLDFLRYPGAVDEPGDGVDQNCDGQDAGMTEAETASPYALAPEEGRRLNVVLICVDAFRADRASFLGYARKTTPHIEALARTSWVFENAIAPSSTTRESIPPLFTGRYASGIAWEGESRIRQVAPSQGLLAEVLLNAGWQTLAVADEWLLKFLPTVMRGFQKMDVAYGLGHWREYGQKAGPFTLFDAVQKLLQRDAKRPFLLYAHFEAAHHPYVPHEGFQSFGNRPSDLYDQELAYADRYVGLLLEFLETEGLMNDTVVVIFGDHGEEFQEHGGSQHSRTLHGESVRVPLVVRIPGQAPRRVKTRVSLVDVFPTLMDALGLRPEEPKPQGFSLYHYLDRADPFPDRPIFAELMVNNEGTLRYRKAIYQGRYKLMWDMSSDEMLLYDVVADPGEHRPLEEPEVQDRLFQVLSDFVARGTHRPGT